MTTAFDPSKVQSAAAPSEGSGAMGAEIREPAVAHGRSS